MEDEIVEEDRLERQSSDNQYNARMQDITEAIVQLFPEATGYHLIIVIPEPDGNGSHIEAAHNLDAGGLVGLLHAAISLIQREAN